MCEPTRSWNVFLCSQALFWISNPTEFYYLYWLWGRNCMLWTSNEMWANEEIIRNVVSKWKKYTKCREQMKKVYEMSWANEKNIRNVVSKWQKYTKCRQHQFTKHLDKAILLNKANRIEQRNHFFKKDSRFWLFVRCY